MPRPSAIAVTASVKTRLGQPVERGAVSLAELGPHELVGRVLELVTLLDLRFDAQAVERAAHERRLDAHPEQAEPPAGLQPDLVEGARQHVRGHVAGLLAEALRPGDGRLAARRERLHAQAQLLHGGPRQRPAHLGDQPRDPSIGRGLVQRAQGWTQLVTAAGAPPRQRIVRVRCGGRLGQVEFEQQRWAVTGQRRKRGHAPTVEMCRELRRSQCGPSQAGSGSWSGAEAHQAS